MLDVFHYAFFYCGVVTGPYYTFATYRHCINGTFWPYTNCLGPTLRRARLIPLYAALYLILGHLWPLEYVQTDAMSERSLWYRLWYMYPIFSHFRMRMYIGFVLSELACMMHGLGAYPTATQPRPGRGPSTGHRDMLQLMEEPGRLAETQYDFESVNNIREARVELDVTMTTVLKQWNTTVQYWLYAVVYRHVPGSKVVRASATMGVSAFWHGIHAGYYLSLLSCPLYMMVEDVWERTVRRRLPAERLWVYDLISWFFRVSMFSYLSMGFLLLRAGATLQYWTSVFFVGHLGMVLLYALGLTLRAVLPKPRTD